MENLIIPDLQHQPPPKDPQFNIHIRRSLIEGTPEIQEPNFPIPIAMFTVPPRQPPIQIPKFEQQRRIRQDRRRGFHNRGHSLRKCRQHSNILLRKTQLQSFFANP